MVSFWSWNGNARMKRLAKGNADYCKHLRKKPDFTVLIIEGNTDDGLVVNDFWQLHAFNHSKVGHGPDELKAFYVMWYDYANEQKDKKRHDNIARLGCVLMLRLGHQ